MKTYEVEISQELANYLQRLGYEVDTRLSIIDRLFTNHKDDTDASVFESVPFKTYSKQLEDVQAEYNMAKDKMTEYLRPLVAETEGVPEEEVLFDWRIDDFNSLKATIIVHDNTGSNGFHVCSCGNGECK